MPATLLVTGASGHLGRGVIRHLIDDQKVAPKDIIAVTRNVEKLDALAAEGVVVRSGDFTKPETLPAAFAGADRVLVLSTDAEPGSGARLAQHKAAIAAAKAAGASKLLYTSMPKPEVSAVSFAYEHLGSEEAVKASGLPYTIFRNGWYHENIFMSVPQALKSGQWFTSAGDGRISYGGRDAFAAAIAAGLASDAAGSQTYTLTGPEAVTTAEIAALVSEIVGKPISVVQLSDEQLEAGLKQHGLPETIAKMIVSFDTNTREGHIDMVTDAVEKLSGSKSPTIRSFIEANKAALAAA